jgi:hypothetical protein
MIAHINKRLSFGNFFSPNHFISNERELTKDPRPKFHEKISYSYGPWPEKSWQNNTRQKQQHEKRKNK